MRKIRRIDEAAAELTAVTGKPAGLWLCRESLMPGAENKRTTAPVLWTGIDADGKKAAVVHGPFKDVIEWLSLRQGTFSPDAPPLIRHPLERSSFVGILVTADGFTRIPDEKIQRAEVYVGFAGIRVPKYKKRYPVSTRAEAEGGEDE